jgi:hypothetical protein
MRLKALRELFFDALKRGLSPLIFVSFATLAASKVSSPSFRLLGLRMALGTLGFIGLPVRGFFVGDKPLDLDWSFLLEGERFGFGFGAL